MNYSLSSLTDRQLKSSRVLDLCRWLSCKVLALKRGEETDLEMFRRRWPDSPNLRVIERASAAWIRGKAAVPGGGTTSSSWGYPLSQGDLGHAFAEYIQPGTLVGRIQNLRRVPLNINVSRSTTRMTAYWAGSGKPKPITQGTLERAILRAAVASGICVFTEEVFEFAVAGSPEFLRDELLLG